MKKTIIIFTFLTLCLTVFRWNAYGQVQLPGKSVFDPSKAVFIYDDVHNFLSALKLIEAGGDPVQTLKAEYFDKGTPGLKEFIAKYDLELENLAEAIQKRPEKYAGLGDIAKKFAAQEDKYRRAYAKLKQFIPNAVFLLTYYLVGDWSGIASGSKQGMLISIERVTSAAGKDALIIHELVHMQQVAAQGYDKYLAIYSTEKSLLAITIREGTAEFLARLVTGLTTQEKAYAYVIKHEAELWQKFSKVMLGKETGDWMWKKPADQEQPPHVAYSLGARIVESYYHNAPDKKQAIKEILACTEYPAFLDKSGYAGKFTKK